VVSTTIFTNIVCMKCFWNNHHHVRSNNENSLGARQPKDLRKITKVTYMTDGSIYIYGGDLCLNNYYIAYRLCLYLSTYNSFVLYNNNNSLFA